MYYDNRFYVGEVLQVVESGKAEVAFVEQVPGQNILDGRQKILTLWRVNLYLCGT